VAARVGFALAFQAEQITTVWAPTGIALAVLLLHAVRAVAQPWSRFGILWFQSFSSPQSRAW
jgi:hypothetical protein